MGVLLGCRQDDSRRLTSGASSATRVPNRIGTLSILFGATVAAEAPDVSRREFSCCSPNRKAQTPLEAAEVSRLVAVPPFACFGVEAGALRPTDVGGFWEYFILAFC